MLRIILGAIAGFVIWSILWLGSDQILVAISPGWYGKHQAEFGIALKNSQAFTANTTILILHLMRSVIISLISGLIVALIAKENIISTVLLGILLLAFGIFVQSMVWNYIPIWYHISFLFLLIPAAVLGGKLNHVSPSRPVLMS